MMAYLDDQMGAGALQLNGSRRECSQAAAARSALDVCSPAGLAAAAADALQLDEWAALHGKRGQRLSDTGLRARETERTADRR